MQASLKYSLRQKYSILFVTFTMIKVFFGVMDNDIPMKNVAVQMFGLNIIMEVVIS